MGNFCSDNHYSQIKELHPKEFQKLVEAYELEKQIGSNFNQSQEKLNSSIAAIEKQELNAISSKKNQVKEHYEKMKQEVDKAYPGGISFLQKGKNAKIEELLQYNLVEKQYSDITENIKTHIAQQKLSANTQLTQIKEQELKKLQDSKPVIKEFSVLGEKLQADTLAQGVKDYKSQIEQKSKHLTEQINKKLGFEGVFQRCRSLVPADKLHSLTQKTKENITKIAASFIGHPNEGKATLF